MGEVLSNCASNCAVTWIVQVGHGTSFTGDFKITSNLSNSVFTRNTESKSNHGKDWLLGKISSQE